MFRFASAAFAPILSVLPGILAALPAALLIHSIGASTAAAQMLPNSKHSDPQDRFFQIDQWWPTPTDQRTASGAPGPEYWQQRADYEIDVTLDDENQRLEAVVTIDYHNQSPHVLSYLWVQLDQNRFRPDSDSATTQTAPSLAPRMSFQALNSILSRKVFDGGYKLESVTDGSDKPIRYTVNKTMMRLDLDEPLPPGQSTEFTIRYSHNIVDAKLLRARGGYEYFPDDDNYVYEIAQWFPRIVSYTDYTGWQHKQFLGRGEFTLELGDYVVRITVPQDMVVTATGELQNQSEVLKPEWIERLKDARSTTKPIFIVTPEEAKANEKNRGEATKTWVFQAENVRDFAFAASRKFIWDAMGVELDDQTVMAMSFYPNEAEPLWSQYSTEAVAHTLEVYGRYAFTYPYPVAISVNGPVYGMEYPMICFNGPRPEKDGTYSKATKYGLISVVIHEVGHNFFPMIVNSDERQWTWMDEGLNTFLQYLAEQEWEDEYPSRRGDPEKIVSYMRGSNQRPIMTGSEEILQFGANAYAKPATALNILRETILGRELFDFAFREYAIRWKFKRPTPSDFFRTMEDASGTDLDWFWRGWFYSTDHVDIAIDEVSLYVIDSGDPDEAAERKRKELAETEPTVSHQRNKPLPKRIDWQPGLKDFYNSDDYDELAVEESARESFRRMIDGLDDEEKALLKRTTNFYVFSFRNEGGLVMPIILRIYYTDNTNERIYIPAEIWRNNGDRVRKLWITDKEIARLVLDPRRETADTEVSNNHWPTRLVPSRFKLFKSSASGNNPMRKARREAEKKAKEKEKEAKAAEEAKTKANGKAAADNDKKVDVKKEGVKKASQDSKAKAPKTDAKKAAAESQSQEQKSSSPPKSDPKSKAKSAKPAAKKTSKTDSEESN